MLGFAKKHWKIADNPLILPRRQVMLYTICMPSQHQIFELRTGRDAEHTPEAAVQLFASIPQLKNRIWHRILKTDERLAFELVVENQQIYFQFYTPTRLADYVKGTLIASYPEIMITELKEDALEKMVGHQATGHQEVATNQQGYFTSLGNLTLKYQQYLPLKTYQDFSDIDPLSPVLSTLSKSLEHDRIVIQFLLKHDNDNWKAAAPVSPESAATDGLSASPTSTKISSAQKQLIQKKIQANTLRTTIKIAVSTENQERSNLLLESIATAFQTLAQSDGNQFALKKVRVFKKNFFKTMIERNNFRGNVDHLTLEELATILHLPNKRLAAIPNIAWGKTLLGEPPEDLPVVAKDSPPEIKDNTNVFGRTTYKNQEVVYGLKRSDRRRHMYVIGKTGTGKSTLLSNMAINDLKNNEGMCVIDPHGDTVETLLNYIPSHRINDVVYFNPADMDRTVQINLFEGENVQHRELIASGIISVFHKLYGYSWGPRLEYILRNALLTLLKVENSRLSDILDLLTNEEFRAKMVNNLDDEILKSFWVDEYNRMQERQRTEAIASILNKVGQFVSSPLVRNVVNARSSSFSIENLMEEGKILLVNLSQGRLGEDNATLLGSMLITKIQLAAMGRVQIAEEDRRDFYLYVDEFQNFATTSFTKILSEARKYRLNLILANQYIAQIPEEVQSAIFGNCGSMVSFVMGANDAGVFQKEFGEMYSVDDLVSLGRYQIINKLAIDNIISKPFPANTLALAKSSNQNRDKVVKVSRERYAKKRD